MKQAETGLEPSTDEAVLSDGWRCWRRPEPGDQSLEPQGVDRTSVAAPIIPQPFEQEICLRQKQHSLSLANQLLGQNTGEQRLSHAGWAR